MEQYNFLFKDQAIEFLVNYLYRRLPSPHRDYASLRKSETCTLYIYSGGYMPDSIPLGYFQNGQFVSNPQYEYI